jgi:hypothetical protein
MRASMGWISDKTPTRGRNRQPALARSVEDADAFHEFYETYVTGLRLTQRHGSGF